MLPTEDSPSIFGFLEQPWHWSFSGAMIALVLFLLTWMGRSFGVSTSFKAMCSAMGAGKKLPFFDLDLTNEYWRLAFVAGGIAGGFFTVLFMNNSMPVAISDSTIAYLNSLGMSYPEVDQTGQGFIPTELFNFSSLKGIFLALAGGYLVGFGARYGRGCTSGHAISGLAHLQLPSFVTVIGFFIGGLLMTHVIFPFLVSL